MSVPSVRFSAFLDKLVAVAQADDRVVGLVGLGSTAARDRVDEWSDHDFWLVVRPGFADEFRRDFSWLPEADRIAVSVVEEHGGGKVIYDDGHVLEFGIGDVGSIATWKANTAEVPYGPSELRAAIAATVSAPPPDPARTASLAEREMALVLTQLLIGVGRARRGERLNASGLIRGDAVGHLLRVVADRLPADRPQLLDDLDATRRVELVHGDLARRIELLLQEDVEACARGLLDLTEAVLSPGWDAFPARGVDAVRRRLGWID